MKKFKASLLAGFVSLGMAIPALAMESWTISLGGTDGTAAFQWDGSLFSSFFVHWNAPNGNFDLDMTGQANTPGAVLTGSLPGACPSGLTGVQLSYLLMSQNACLSSGTFSWRGQEKSTGQGDQVDFRFQWTDPDGNVLLKQTFDVDEFCSNPANSPNRCGREDGNWTITGGPNLVPEPASVALLGLGLAGLGLMRRRKAA